jgi:hypothetical protein
MEAIAGPEEADLSPEDDSLDEMWLMSKDRGVDKLAKRQTLATRCAVRAEPCPDGPVPPRRIGASDDARVQRPDAHLGLPSVLVHPARRRLFEPTIEALPVRQRIGCTRSQPAG